MAEEKKEDLKVEQAIPDMVKLLATIPNAPNQVDIEKWKEKFGEIFVSGFSETELFIWRPLQRGEYVALQKKLREPPKDQNSEPHSDLEFEEWVTQTCILWSSNVQTCVLKGGSVSTLSEQIMQNSNFLAPQVASMLVMKL